MKREVTTKSSEQTHQLARRLGANLRGGEVIEFVSDVGGGKTTFVRGLAEGTGSDDHVSSPTFKISNVYKAPRFFIHHFDFYRLHDPGIIEHELHDALLDGNDVVVIEWADSVAQILPDTRLSVTMQTTGTTHRTITFEYPESLAYLME